ncbi:LAME_0D03422g1_1 [Lachancea meyersii CBS 8951]|uniref:LAME_0D03422g1_1 n=1 Tax=Lachancea meyersii CBS 8951 TaxID=1266667 RepID=A0A1G4J7U7_9SACH|nr:LAME_0D03422g1_1 [Lachancea meyersii CBS 8951]
MLQLIISPAILLISTVIPLQLTIEYLNLGGSGAESSSLSVSLLKFWCLHAMIRVVPNPLVYIFQSLPLSNIAELAAWLVLAKELVSQFCRLETAKGLRVDPNTPASKEPRSGWASYFLSISNPPPTDRYVFGQLTFYTLKIMDRWPLDLQILDTSFRTVMVWISRIRSKSLVKPEEPPTGWAWSYQWFAGQTTRTNRSDEEYDLLEDVIEDIKRS